MSTSRANQEKSFSISTRTWRAQGTWAAGDTFKVSIEAGPVVKYYQNGTVVFTSGTNPTTNYPYVLGTTLYNIGVSVNNALIGTP